MSDDTSQILSLSSGIALSRRTVLAGGTAVFLAGGSRVAATPRSTSLPQPGMLARDFADPPHQAGLGAYWYWLNGAVTRAGISADLAAMRDNGITTAMLFAIGAASKPPLVDPPADALTETWWALIDHAVAEADRLGLTISLNICDGWATASGPWITPELSMQVITWSEMRVGAGDPPLVLPPPPSKRDYCRDIAVLAFPWPESFDADSASLRPKVTTTLPLRDVPLDHVLDRSNAADVFDTSAPGHIDFTFGAPFTLRSVTVRTPSPWGYAPGVYRAANSLEVLASDDSEQFRPVGFLEYPQHGWQTDLTTLTHALPETTARVFRFIHHPHEPGAYAENFDFGQDMRLRLFSLELSSRPELHQIVAKSGAQWGLSRRTTARDIGDAACVDPGTIIDLSGHMRPDGRLDWTSPAGRWRVLRIAATTNGHENSAAGGAQGLEVDRFNRDAVAMQFDRWFGKALARVGPSRAGRVLNTVHVDSWEASGQNWSPRFAARFRALRGYALEPWLPVMAGVPVASAAQSEAVLHDIRATIAELTQSEFFGTVASLAHAQGCRFSGEPASPTYAVDGLRWADATDVPMGEFWLRTPRNDKPTDVADAVSGGHIYGKPVIATESFTENDIQWDEHPGMLKPLGDRHYCRGINRFMLHVYTAQPFLDRVPGMTLGGIGTMFSRTQTWWTEGRGWFDYMRRIQAVLQHGAAVVDVAVFVGEEIPSRAVLDPLLPAPIPAGWRHDSINRDALLRLARVERGVIVLPGGARYRLLMLPTQWRASRGFLAGLGRLIAAGAVVLGPPPSGPLGLADDPRGFAGDVAALWGNMPGAAGQRRLGDGKLVWGKSPAEVLNATGIGASIAGEGTDDLDWTHRSGSDGDVWFVANRNDAPLQAKLSLRGSGMAEIWDPRDGRRIAARGARSEGMRTALTLDFAPHEAWLVVIRPVGDALPNFVVPNPRPVPAPMEPGGAWTLDFSGPGAPSGSVSLLAPTLWSTLADPAQRHHSGQGRYVTRIVLSPDRLDPALAIRLDLGTVREMARVTINGHAAGSVWSAPFALDVTRWLCVGENLIEIVVTNTWHNRLAGDAGLPDDRRMTWVFPQLRGGKPWLPAADAPLIPSGLGGQVRLVWSDRHDV